MHLISKAVAVVLLALASLPPTVWSAESRPATNEYVFGVFPHLPPRDLEEVYGPMAADLTSHIGRRVVLASSTTFERFSESLDKGQFDVAFVQPFEYIRIAEKFGYLPLASRTERLSGIVVVAMDSPLKSLADLKGKRLALPPDSAAVTQLILRHLRQGGVQPGRDVAVSHHRSHVSCMQQVVIGEADGCGTAAPALRFFQNKMNVELKTVVTTRDIPHSLFVAHPRVPEKVRALLRERIINWSNTEEGKKILARGELTPFKHVADREYNVVRDLSR
jgi:phosphonate transport system substrate-binding protein